MSFLEKENAEPLVTSDEEEGESAAVKDLPYDNTDDEGESETLEFLKRPTTAGPTIEDFLEEDKEEVPAEPEERQEIDIAELVNLSRDEAAYVAEEVVGVLEEDLAEYIKLTGTVFLPPLSKTDIKRIRMGLKETDSASSFNSELSDILPGEPSKIRMEYDKCVSVFRDLSLVNLFSEDMVDKEMQVNLHRVKRKMPVPKLDAFSQTLEMTFHAADVALILFKRYYPQVDDYKVKEQPSRKASQELAIERAMEADPFIDTKRKGPAITRITNKKQLLQPLMDNYYKNEKLWTGCSFSGEFLGRQFFKGRYMHPSGSKLESEFQNGHFHTFKHFGQISYPRGDTFEGEWEEGRYQTGQITFCDGLKFSSSNWKYCEPPDRRFKVERYYGIKPAGKTLFSDANPPPYVPGGMYDVGDGYYNPKNGDVRRYDGFLQRRATAGEKRWIESNCRRIHDAMEYVAPKFLTERIPGSYCDAQRRIPLTKKRYH